MTREPTSPTQLPSERGFWWLIVTQFQGAFSDNALKSVVTFMGLAMATSERGRESIVPLLGVLFSVPFLLFSMAGGYLADRYSKRTVTIGIKVFEIGVMTLTTVGLWLGHLPIAMGGVFLMGVHSAIFGPAKYGMLPEILPKSRLSWGNGVMEMTTFLAIIAGGAAGAVLYSLFKGQQLGSGAVLLALAGVGLLCSFGITRLPAASPTKVFRPNFLVDLAAQIQSIRRDRTLWLAVLGNAFFAGVGVMVLQNAILFGTETLRVDEIRTSALQAALGIGIGIGGVAAGYLSGGKIEYGLIPLGSLGLTVGGALLARPGLSFAGAIANLAVLGFFGGWFIVPVAAIMQHRPAKDEKGAVLAAGNLLSFVGVLIASALYWALTGGLGLSTRQVFLLTAGLMFGATLYALWLLPDAMLRFALWLLTHTIYRIRVVGRENVPETGGALLVVNHLSFADALLMIASTDRHIRFLMYEGHYRKKLLNPFMRIMRVIPISSQQRPREMVASLRAASEAIARGELVCIFAEGQISRIGMMLPFRRGFERIMKGVEAPIIPVNLEGVWGSIFSHAGGRFFSKVPRRIPYPVVVSFGRPMPPDSAPYAVRHAVQELATSAWRFRRKRMRTIHRGFIATARRHPFRLAMVDGTAGRLRFGEALARAVFLARRLRPSWRCQHKVGILLPPSAAGALVNHAALLCGKVPVNLNYTLSEEALVSCIRQCAITTVVTSRAFLERLPQLKVPCATIFVEEAAARPRLIEKRIVAAMAWLLPAALLERALHGGSSEAAVSPPSNVGFSPSQSSHMVSSVSSPSDGGLSPSQSSHTVSSVSSPSDGGLSPSQLSHTELSASSSREAGLSRSARDPSPASRSQTPERGAIRSRRTAAMGDLATIIFSSGSTGDPKGVMLSHYNIVSNVEQVAQTFEFARDDRILGVLPFFHSFGFMGTLAMPAAIGIGGVYHPNPLDARAIGPLVRDNAVTFMVATPTFLQLYMRACAPEDFGSLRFIMTGAEKLPERVGAAFEEKFGIRPMEGYGCTECSPAVALNVFDYRAPGFRQVGAKRGSIGHPLPGISTRIVDPDRMTHSTTVGPSTADRDQLTVAAPASPTDSAQHPSSAQHSPTTFNGESTPDLSPSGLRDSGADPSPRPRVVGREPAPEGIGKYAERLQAESRSPAPDQNGDSTPELPAESLPPGESGLLLVSGPNVMMGYLGRPDLTAEVLRHGWYVTGDIASEDEDGFLRITDRLSRFSKIGGEMVPHIKVEEALHALAGLTDQSFAVAGVPDEKKGERLVVLHTLDDARLKATIEGLAAAGLPNLWVPRAADFHRIESLPLLGTGKLDLRKVRQLALELAAGASSPPLDPRALP